MPPEPRAPAAGVLSRRALVFALAALPACVPRARLAQAPPAAGAALRDIHVATTRAPDGAGGFGAGRARSLTWARFTLSIPPGRAPGSVPTPRRGERADPRRHFAVAQAVIHPNAAAFRADLRRALAARGGEAILYVHGFNNSFADGLYRIAQLGADLGLSGVEAHFSWPSAAQALNYVGDRDSALYSRDGLARLLVELRAAGARHVAILAHSMGCFLTMETLRQIALGGPGDVRRLVDAVVLFSPDLDVELFHAQALRIGRLPQPFIIFTSQRDRALALSALLAGRRQRLGRLEDYAALADLDVLVFDVSAFRAGVDNHFALARSPVLQQVFRGLDRVDAALAADRAGRIGLIDGTILTLQTATAIILQPVAGILD